MNKFLSTYFTLKENNNFFLSLCFFICNFLFPSFSIVYKQLNSEKYYLPHSMLIDKTVYRNFNECLSLINAYAAFFSKIKCSFLLFCIPIGHGLKKSIVIAQRNHESIVFEAGYCLSIPR